MKHKLQNSADHLPTLDGMRGIAALAVLLLHIRMTLSADNIISGDMPLPHVFLAVDFFFILSGFVIAKAYEAKLKTSMRFGRFVAIRFVRLYPLVLIGALMGGFVYAMRVFIQHDTTFGQLLPALGLAMLSLPTTALLAVRPDEIWPINPPQWSLFFEIIINLVYAPLVNWLSNRKLAVICTLTALGYLAVGLKIGHIDVDATPETSSPTSEMLMGALRVTFAFFIGVLLYRRISLKKPKFTVPGWLVALVLAGVIGIPCCGEGWAYDYLAVAFVLPAIVYFGAISKNGPILSVIFLFLGELSYPLYITHYAVLRSLANGFKILHLPITGIAAIGVAIAVSIIAAVILDKLMGSADAEIYLKPLSEPQDFLASTP